MTPEASREDTVSPKILGIETEGMEEVEEIEEEEEGVIKFEDPRKTQVRNDKEFVRKLADPKMPSEEARKMHWLQGHYPYRNWCEVCVKAMDRDTAHEPEEKEREVPEYGFDY